MLLLLLAAAMAAWADIWAATLRCAAGILLIF
jgi:hypothetical protein